MNCNLNNPCMGVYGKCLDVKITNICNGNCNFCIEKDGLKTENVSVDKLIESTNKLKDYKKVLILGGEPLLYPYLYEYLEGIKEKDEIYITTNGSLLTESIIYNIASYLTAINISIHHYDEDKNSQIIKTRVDFNQIQKSIKVLKSYGVGVRINTNLIKGGIDTQEKAIMMILFAKLLGSDTIRFAELQNLQNCSELFVDASNIFNDIHKNPFTDGCEQELNIVDGIKVYLRLTCGIVNPLKEKPLNTNRKGSETKVMYTNSKVYNGWVGSDNCHRRSRRIGDSCHSVRGCH